MVTRLPPSGTAAPAVAPGHPGPHGHQHRRDVVGPRPSMMAMGAVGRLSLAAAGIGLVWAALALAAS